MSHVALTKCYYCGKDNEILLDKRLKDISALHGKVCTMNPCNECQEFMKKSIILIGIDEEKSDPGWNSPPSNSTLKERQSWMPNPYRTGSFVVVTEQGFERMINEPSLVAYGKKHRWMFIDHKALVHVGAVKA